MKKYFKLFTIVLCSMLAVLSTNLCAQSISISNGNRHMVELGDEEKAIKASSGCIKAKQDIVWETNLNNIKIAWRVTYDKDAKMYTLYKQSIKYYQSSTIGGIRSKYASDLLGREIKVQ